MLMNIRRPVEVRRAPGGRASVGRPCPCPCPRIPAMRRRSRLEAGRFIAVLLFANFDIQIYESPPTDLHTAPVRTAKALQTARVRPLHFTHKSCDAPPPPWLELQLRARPPPRHQFSLITTLISMINDSFPSRIPSPLIKPKMTRVIPLISL